MLFGVNFNVVESPFTPPLSKVDEVKGVSTSGNRQQGQNRKNGSLDDVLDLSKEAEKASKAFKVEGELTEEERKQVEELKRIDQAVRQHEQAHKAVGGQYVRGGANYEYKKGPDGQLYAVGGDVKIDVGEVPNDPEATIEKMQTVRRAALAPADPSPQDRRVAAEASRKENKARAELTREQTQESISSVEDIAEKDVSDSLPGKKSAVFEIKDAESYRVDPPENLFELFA